MIPCYVCQKPVVEEDPHFPFDSKECHEQWAAKHYGSKEQPKPGTVKEVQARIRKIVEERQKKRAQGNT